MPEQITLFSKNIVHSVKYNKSDWDGNGEFPVTMLRLMEIYHKNLKWSLS